MVGNNSKPPFQPETARGPSNGPDIVLLEDVPPILDVLVAHGDDSGPATRLRTENASGDALKGFRSHEVDLVAHLGNVHLAIMDKQLGITKPGEEQSVQSELTWR